MTDLLLALYEGSLRRLFSRKAIDRIFRNLPAVPSPRDTADVTLCALQLEAKTHPNPGSWIRELDGILSDAAGKGARLICLPELYGMMPCLCHPLIHCALKRLSGGDGGDSEGPLRFDLLPVMEKLGIVNGIYEDIICRFAKRYGTYLYGGTAFVAEGGKVYNRGFLVNPAGNILAHNDKLHLTQEEMQLGLSAGDALQVVPTEIGNIALCVCMDATYFETFRMAGNLGADYIIVPIGDMAQFDPWLALRGAQTRVNETGLPAVKPALVSADGFPMLFSGRTGIYFPEGHSGESTELPSHKGSGMVLAHFAPGQSYDHVPFLRENPGFARNYFTALRNYTEGEST